jgi:hypothetical protein
VKFVVGRRKIGVVIAGRDQRVYRGEVFGARMLAFF